MQLRPVLRARRVWRSLYVACALVGSVALVALAAYDGVWARRQLEREVRRALEDDAAYIARGVATGLQYQLYSALEEPFALVRDDTRPDLRALPTVTEFAARARRAMREATSLPPAFDADVAVARYDGATGQFAFDGPRRSAIEDSALARELRETLARATANGDDRRGPRREDNTVQLWALAGHDGPRFRGIAYAAHALHAPPSSAPLSRAPTWYAVAYRRRDVYTLVVSDVLATLPVLPPTYEGQDWDVNHVFAVDSTLVAIRVTDRESGVTLYARPARWPARSAADGVLDNRRGPHGVRIDVRLSDALASRLVAAGAAAPPRGHDALLWVLLAVAAALALSSLWMLRGEHVAAREQIAFLAQLSHELRTPLTRIRMHAEMLRLGRARSAEQRARVTEVIERAERDLTALVENVLTLTRSDLPEWRIHRTPQRLDALVREAVRDFEPQAEARGTAVELTRADACRVLCDATLVRQAVANLLENAAKYGPRGQRVRVSLEAAGDSAVLRVVDEGRGIEARDRRRVWRLYTRLRDARRTASGSGLGLGVVRVIVAKHRGAVAVEDAPDGSGACFRVTLPLAEQRDAHDDAADAESDDASREVPSGA